MTSPRYVIRYSIWPCLSQAECSKAGSFLASKILAVCFVVALADSSKVTVEIEPSAHNEENRLTACAKTRPQPAIPMAPTDLRDLRSVTVTAVDGAKL